MNERKLLLKRLHLLDFDVNMSESFLDEFFDRVSFTSSENEIIRFVLLHDAPHAFNVVASCQIARVNAVHKDDLTRTDHVPNHVERPSYRGTSILVFPG